MRNERNCFGPSRRDLLRLSAQAAAAGVLLRPSFGWAAAGQQAWGVQLYMVRDEAARDLPGVLRAIRAAGYTEVEPYGGSYTRPARELKAMIADAGLTAPSGHVNYTEIEQRIPYAQELGLQYVICPMIPAAQWNPAGFRKAAADYNRWGHTLQAAGLRFAHHNHDYEFRPLDNGKTGWSILLGETDPQLVGLELDCYWAVQAGQDVQVMLTALRERIHLLHLKDRDRGAPTSFDMGASSDHFAPMGQGSIAWKPLIEQAQRQGVRYFFMDQDKTAGPPLDSVRASFRYLQSLNV